jgi:hypothetical protein
MEYRGIEYSIVQGIERDTWKWTVTSPTISKSGRARSKSEAAEEVEHMIDVMRAPKQRRFMRRVTTDDGSGNRP